MGQVIRTLRNLSLSLISLVLTWAVLELAARLAQSHPVLSLRNFRGEARVMYEQGLPVQFDAALGWIPRIGYSGKENRWHSLVTILENGIRSNGRVDAIPASPSVLTVGDSFTFGDEVSDHETWPALLEARLGKRVVNGGVFAYGTDQTLLRLQQLLPIYSPDTIIYSFIGADLNRSEFSSVSGVPKPFFDAHDGQLTLRNSPVPIATTAGARSGVQTAIGHSSIIHWIMMRLSPNVWLSRRRFVQQHTGNDGSEITCLIFARLEALAARADVERTIVLVQDTVSPQPQDVIEGTDRALGCIDRDAIEVVDLRTELEHLRRRNPGRHKSFFRTHMTPAGNRFVARVLADRLSEAQTPHHPR